MYKDLTDDAPLPSPAKSTSTAGEDGEEADNADANVIYGTYIDKDSSEKPPGIKKMLKVSQPAFIFFVTHANLSSFNRDPSPGLP